MLEFVDSIILNTDITKDEILEILDHSPSTLGIYKFGFISVMYSRRTLISNYVEHYSLPDIYNIRIKSNNKQFIGLESSDGTVFYDTPVYINNEFDNDSRIKYYFINSLWISNDDLLEYIKTSKVIIDTYDGFLHKKTVYKLKGGDNNA
jgi:hypothetical protein